MNFVEFKEALDAADMILVGIGEDFEHKRFLQTSEEYCEVCTKIATAHTEWMMPYVNHKFLEKDTGLKQAYKNLERLLLGKNYFVLTTCMDGMIRQTGLKQDRIVEPCGTYAKMQCIRGCENSVMETDKILLKRLDDLISQNKEIEVQSEIVCKHCGNPMVLNSLYAEKYDESGYMADWALYTKWLQGTLNKKLCILELGSGMMFANVLRFRFEKIAGLNQKSTLVRVHKHLYQLPEEVAGRGRGIAMDAVDFMAEMPEVC